MHVPSQTEGPGGREGVVDAEHRSTVGTEVQVDEVTHVVAVVQVEVVACRTRLHHRGAGLATVGVTHREVRVGILVGHVAQGRECLRVGVGLGELHTADQVEHVVAEGASVGQVEGTVIGRVARAVLRIRSALQAVGLGEHCLFGRMEDGRLVLRDGHTEAATQAQFFQDAPLDLEVVVQREGVRPVVALLVEVPQGVIGVLIAAQGCRTLEVLGDLTVLVVFRIVGVGVDEVAECHRLGVARVVVEVRIVREREAVHTVGQADVSVERILARTLHDTLRVAVVHAHTVEEG